MLWNTLFYTPRNVYRKEDGYCFQFRSNSKSTLVVNAVHIVMYSSVQLPPMNEIELKDDDPTIIPRNCKENSPATSTLDRKKKADRALTHLILLIAALYKHYFVFGVFVSLLLFNG